MPKPMMLTEQDMEDLAFSYYLAGWLSTGDTWNADSFEIPDGTTLKEVLFEQFIEFERTLAKEAAVTQGEAPVSGVRGLRQEEVAGRDVPI